MCVLFFSHIAADFVNIPLGHPTIIFNLNVCNIDESNDQLNDVFDIGRFSSNLLADRLMY